MIGERKIIQLVKRDGDSYLAVCNDGTIWGAYYESAQQTFCTTDLLGNPNPSWIQIKTQIPIED